MPDLFSPFDLGPITLPNRILMAPMTRNRAGADGVPTDMMAHYYAQRADAGLIITEATDISLTSRDSTNRPGLFTDAQVAGWRSVTDAIHQAGGRIFAQIWHSGRASHPSVQPGGTPPPAPSAIAAEGEIYTPDGRQPYPVPRALELEEIESIVQDFARAADRATEAGFDGVELHGANGYLIEGFLYTGSNRREDHYGGSIENRARFLLDVVAAVTDRIGADRVGLRLSPQNSFFGMHTEDRDELYAYVLDQLNPFGLAYLHLLELLPGHHFLPPEMEVPERMTPALRERFAGPLIVNGGHTLESGQDAVRTAGADLVAFGMPFVANPDLVERFKRGAELNPPNPETLYGGDEKGYTDYPALDVA